MACMACCTVGHPWQAQLAQRGFDRIRVYRMSHALDHADWWRSEAACDSERVYGVDDMAALRQLLLQSEGEDTVFIACASAAYARED